MAGLIITLTIFQEPLTVTDNRIYNGGTNSTLIATLVEVNRAFTFELSGQPATLVWNARTADVDYNTQILLFPAALIIPATITNENALVVYAGGNTTFNTCKCKCSKSPLITVFYWLYTICKQQPL